MNTLIASLSLVLGLASAAPAFGAEGAKSEWTHTFFGSYGGGYTMVACSYAESVVEGWMERLGASHIDVRCTGGIQPYGTSPLSLYVSYEAPVLSGETKVEKLTFESDGWDSNCIFDTSVMRSLLRSFPNVKALRKSDACFGAQSRYTYDLEVTLPKK
jgi:hypothetical protein